jgi:N-acetylmuramoyl-L-alanine amidase CwlA
MKEKGKMMVYLLKEATIMPEIIQSLLPVSSNCRTGIKRQIKYLVIHETGNRDKGANAKAHASYLNNVAKAKTPSVSWHYTVDDKEIYQHIPDDEVAWHAGDGTKNPGGNMNGIGIELCVNSDGDFAKTIANAVWLVGYLMKKYGFNSVGWIVRQHWEFSKKNCPQMMREQGLWPSFMQSCQNEIDKLNAPAPVVIIPPAPDYKALYESEHNTVIGLNANISAITNERNILQERLTKANNLIEGFKTLLSNF